MVSVCKGCGTIKGIAEYDEHLWDIYYRVPDLISRSHIPPLVYTQDDCEDEEDCEAMMNAMGRNMRDRGCCSECGRPDLRGVDLSDLMTDAEVQEMNDIYAEQEAERRMGA